MVTVHCSSKCVYSPNFLVPPTPTQPIFCCDKVTYSPPPPLPLSHLSYKWGRRDCASPDTPNTEDEAALNLPTSVLGADEMMDYFAEEFGFDMPEVGRHTLTEELTMKWTCLIKCSAL